MGTMTASDLSRRGPTGPRYRPRCMFLSTNSRPWSYGSSDGTVTMIPDRRCLWTTQTERSSFRRPSASDTWVHGTQRGHSWVIEDGGLPRRLGLSVDPTDISPFHRRKWSGGNSTKTRSFTCLKRLLSLSQTEGTRSVKTGGVCRSRVIL